jgi:integrase
VPIPPPLFSLLQELKTKDSGEFVLPRNRLWQKGEQALALREFLRGIGLPEVHFHALRSTWATLLLSKGIAPAIVMTCGGWQSLATMMIYLRKAGISVRGATDCLSLDSQPSNVTELVKFG